MRVFNLFLIVIILLSALFTITPSAFSQYLEQGVGETPVSPRLKTITIRNVRYLLPKGTKFRKRAGVITFEGPGEYTARILSELEERLHENEKELNRLERVLGGRGSEQPVMDAGH